MQSFSARSENSIANITIRNLDEYVKARLRRRAAQHQRSMEEVAAPGEGASGEELTGKPHTGVVFHKSCTVGELLSVHP